MNIYSTWPYILTCIYTFTSKHTFTYTANNAIKTIAEETIEARKHKQLSLQSKGQKEDKLISMLSGVLGAIQQNVTPTVKGDKEEKKEDESHVDKQSSQKNDKSGSIITKYNNWSISYMCSEQFDGDTLREFENFLFTGDEQKKKIWLLKFEQMLSANVAMDTMVKVMKALMKWLFLLVLLWILYIANIFILTVCQFVVNAHSKGVTENYS